MPPVPSAIDTPRYVIMHGVEGNGMATSSIMANFTAREARVTGSLALGIAAVFRKIAPIDAKAVLFDSRACGDAMQEAE